MIRRGELDKMKFEVEKVVKEAFKAASSNSKNNDFALFLCVAQYVQWDNSGFNPYWIDYRMDEQNDELRLNILLDYANLAYSSKQVNTMDTEFSVTLELMIYSHMWESKPFLKQLKRLCDLSSGKPYNWNVQIPDFSKHDFIRNEIREEFKKVNLEIHEVITQGYHSQLRNAFAHSDYVLETLTPKIEFLNYSEPSWQMENLTFDDWTKKFCYTFLLGYEMHNKFHTYRQSLDEGEIVVLLKDNNGADVNGVIIYDKINDSFQGKIKPLTT